MLDLQQTFSIRNFCDVVLIMTDWRCIGVVSI